MLGWAAVVKVPAIVVAPEIGPANVRLVAVSIVIPDNVPVIVELPTAVSDPIERGSACAIPNSWLLKFPAVIFLVVLPDTNPIRSEDARTAVVGNPETGV
jgi:hypothetical protein